MPPVSTVRAGTGVVPAAVAGGAATSGRPGTGTGQLAMTTLGRKGNASGCMLNGCGLCTYEHVRQRRVWHVQFFTVGGTCNSGFCDYCQTVPAATGYVPPVLPPASVSSGNGGGDHLEVPVARL